MAFRDNHDWDMGTRYDDFMIRAATTGDYSAILAMNLAFESLLSPMDEARLVELHTLSNQLRVVELDSEVAGVLLTFREDSAYDSANYRWFDERYERFLYVDRVVVAAAYQSAGVGRMLYDDLMAGAKAEQVPSVTCEYNIVPPNKISQRFHNRYGFTEIGRQASSDGKKQLAMCVSDVEADRA
jgi:predicted GNAT superfamily acetyltransferase